jgi:hypothetical protein
MFFRVHHVSLCTAWIILLLVASTLSSPGVHGQLNDLGKAASFFFTMTTIISLFKLGKTVDE